MTPRDWHCFQCNSHFATDAQGELVDHTPLAQMCLGCRRLWVILEASARKRALIQAATVPDPPLTLGEIDRRLRRGRLVSMGFDYGKAAANDRDDEE
jgi:hypothetical protein